MRKRTTRNRTVIFSILTLLFFIPINIYGFTIGFTGKYVHIDLLSQKDCLCFVCLDIRAKKINFQIDNQSLTFTQENELDSVQMFVEQNLISRFDNEYILLTISELLQVDSDTIYVSAKYQKFNEKGNVGKIRKIERLGVCRSELLGVVISPPTKEIKKRKNVFYWVTGILTVTITTLSIIFGN